jgi:hypothetical protein
MGDSVAHLSSTSTRKILVKYLLLEEGSSKLPCIRKNKSTERSVLGREAQPHYCVFLIKLALPFSFPFSSRRRIFEGICFHPLLYLSLVLTCKHEGEARIRSISGQEEQADCGLLSLHLRRSTDGKGRSKIEL